MFARKTANTELKSCCSTITHTGSKDKLHPCTERQPKMKISFKAEMLSALVPCTKVDFIQRAVAL